MSLRNATLVLSVSAVLSAALFLATPSVHVPSGPEAVPTVQPVTRAPVQRLSSHRSHTDHAKAATVEEHDHHEAHGVAYDPSKPFDPSAFSETHPPQT